MADEGSQGVEEGKKKWDERWDIVGTLPISSLLDTLLTGSSSKSPFSNQNLERRKSGVVVVRKDSTICFSWGKFHSHLACEVEMDRIVGILMLTFGLIQYLTLDFK
jgi:hypothetical protein